MVSLEENCRRECFGLDNLKRQRKYDRQFLKSSRWPPLDQVPALNSLVTIIQHNQLQVFFLKENDNEWVPELRATEYWEDF